MTWLVVLSYPCTSSHDVVRTSQVALNLFGFQNRCEKARVGRSCSKLFKRETPGKNVESMALCKLPAGRCFGYWNIFGHAYSLGKHLSFSHPFLMLEGHFRSINDHTTCISASGRVACSIHLLPFTSQQLPMNQHFHSVLNR